MDWKEYCERTEDTAVYPTEKRLEYLVMGLAGEAGEVANLTKKFLRGDFDDNVPEFWKRLDGELGGVAWYLGQLSLHYCQNVLEHNLAKLLGRKARGTIKGSGDDR